MRNIKEILRLKLSAKLSHDQVACALKVSKGVITKYVTLASASGLDWPTISTLEESTLEQRLLGKPEPSLSVFAVPDYGRIHHEMRRKGMTLMLLWEEYQAEFSNQKTWRYTQFCEHYRNFCGKLKRSMRQIHRAGEKLFIDYAGPTIGLTDDSRAHIFVSALGASKYTYACATPHETMVDWLESTAKALTFYGGCTELIVPDCPRALIANANRYEPKVNETVLDFARHYSTSFLPARPRSPRDKPLAESAVQVIERWIMMRLRHQKFANVHEVNTAILPLLKLLNDKPFQKLPGSRASVFAELDAPALRPLPAQRYEFASFKKVTVDINHHVSVEKHYYSVPHALVGRTVEARITRSTVEILYRGQRVASHARDDQLGGFSTVKAHMPAAHRAHLEWTPKSLVAWGLTIGPATAVVVTRLLEEHTHPEHGYRSCLGLRGLAKRYSKPRLETACTLALQLGTCKYIHVRDILANNRDKVAPATSTEWTSPDHANVRGADYYQ